MMLTDRTNNHSGAGSMRRNKNSSVIRPAVAELELTGRQSQIVEGLAHGLDGERIAAQLSISCATARTHLRNIYRTLRVKSRSELVALVLANVAANVTTRRRSL